MVVKESFGKGTAGKLRFELARDNPLAASAPRLPPVSSLTVCITGRATEVGNPARQIRRFADSDFARNPGRSGDANVPDAGRILADRRSASHGS
jgi:hypothetical protein